MIIELNRCVLLLIAINVLQGCAFISPSNAPDPESGPAAANQPEVDYSDTSPDCATAARRITENVTVGAPMRDIKRLVGKPAYELPGIWLWSSSFSRTGQPYVRYNAVTSNLYEAKVTEISVETSKC